mgnify:CR=1 FL=1
MHINTKNYLVAFFALNQFCWKYTNTFLSYTKKSNKEMHFY